MVMPFEQVYWFLNHITKPRRLTQSQKADVVIVGGGLAGLGAAQACHERGLSVVVIEKALCGSGGSGLSSGFITPNSELGLSHYLHEYGPEKAKMIWDLVQRGGDIIKKNIDAYAIDCDYVAEETLIVANSLAGFADLYEEHKSFQKLGYKSALYFKKDISKLIGSETFDGGLTFNTTFGINPFKYVQTMKERLVEKGVHIFEETLALKVHKNYVQTPFGDVYGEHIIVCVDRAMQDLNLIPSKVSQVQTFIMLSSVLDQDTIKKIFPDKRYMVWDTDLVYQYYRLTADNRFLIGGSTMWLSYQKQTTCHPKSVVKKLSAYMKSRFPDVSLNFEYIWPGMIGISKDLSAIAGRDRDIPNHYYVTAVTGLPWAVTLGRYAVEHLFDGRTDMDEMFSPYRSFPLSDGFHYILGKSNTFALSDLISMKLV